GKCLLIELTAFGRGRDGIEDTGVGDARFGVIGHELVSVGGYTDPWIAGLFDHGFLESSKSPTCANPTRAGWGDRLCARRVYGRAPRRSPGLSPGDQSGQDVQVSTVSSGPEWDAWRQLHGESHASNQSGYAK